MIDCWFRIVRPSTGLRRFVWRKWALRNAASRSKSTARCIRGTGNIGFAKSANICGENEMQTAYAIALCFLYHFELVLPFFWLCCCSHTHTSPVVSDLSFVILLFMGSRMRAACGAQKTHRAYMQTWIATRQNWNRFNQRQKNNKKLCDCS